MDVDEFGQNLSPLARALPKLNEMSLAELLTTDDPDILAARDYVAEQILTGEPDHYCTSHGHC